MPNPCKECVHSMDVPYSELHCGRSGGWYRCEDERALGWVAALAYHACGAEGRFFARRTHEPATSPLPGGVVEATTLARPPA